MSVDPLAAYVKVFKSYGALILEKTPEVPEDYQRKADSERIMTLRNRVRDAVARWRGHARIRAIDVAEVNGKWLIVDGQHRFRAYEQEWIKAIRDGVPPREAQMIFVVQPCASYEEARQYYLDIQKAMPITEYEVAAAQPRSADPVAAEEVDGRTRKGDLIQTILSTDPIFSRFFGEPGSRRPKMNRTQFIDAFLSSPLEEVVEDGEDFREVMGILSADAADKYPVAPKYSVADSTKAKCDAAGFHLGLAPPNHYFSDDWDGHKQVKRYVLQARAKRKAQTATPKQQPRSNDKSKRHRAAAGTNACMDDSES